MSCAIKAAAGLKVRDGGGGGEREVIVERWGERVQRGSNPGFVIFLCAPLETWNTLIEVCVGFFLNEVGTPYLVNAFTLFFLKAKF